MRSALSSGLRDSFRKRLFGAASNTGCMRASSFPQRSKVQTLQRGSSRFPPRSATRSKACLDFVEQTPVERVSFAAFVVQAALDKRLAGLFSGHGNLLIACMKITSYNDHCSAPFLRALVVCATKSTRS